MKGFPARRAAQQKPGWQWDKERAAELIHPKRFQARGEGIRDLSFLEGLTGLKELDLWDNDIENLSPPWLVYTSQSPRASSGWRGAASA
ncbi:MAG: leucine-rich repeat domain-containing protein, partial [Acutalibacter sp.]|nr:leucine-rich repeat domain-containing protein [Acutalibacter sp.]